MNKLIASLKWIDDNLIKLFVVAFIFIIPLYPKFPLSHVNYTYVSIRLEDLFVALMAFVYIIQLLRKKVVLNKKFAILFVLFWASVFAAYLLGVYVFKTIPFRQLGLLHSLRRVEYMLVFFVALSSIRSKKDFFHYVYIISFVLFLTCIYGVGQKFFGLPAVQTMNPAFAQGMILYLTPEARVSSTFAGHYDFAAYLVFLLPVVLGLYLYKRNLLLYLFFALGIFLIVLTASRISFAAYAVSIIAFLVFVRKPKALIVVVIITVAFNLFNQNLGDRFFKTFQIKQLFVNEKTGEVVVPQKISTKELPAGTAYVPIANTVDKTKTAQNEQQVKSQLLNQIIEDASRSGKVLTASEQAQLLATLSANLKPVNTVVSDISFSTRLTVEWPRAVNAFIHDPVLGTGPSSITEATDNDYLRWIGEMGALGTGLFFFILYSIAMTVWKCARKVNKPENYIYYGFLFGFAGLMINASYIDVFEASKVAYTFWTVAGIFVGASLIPVTESKKTETNKK